MLEIKAMTKEDKNTALEMMTEFYHSPAVDHEVPQEVFERTINDAIARNGIDGYILRADGKIAGYSLITTMYAAEVGGKCVMVEEIYFKDAFRGRGYGRQYFGWLKETYKEARRIRLEVTAENTGAIRFYKDLGFQWLNYGQMVLE